MNEDLLLDYLDGKPIDAGRFERELIEDSGTGARLAELALQETLLCEMAEAERAARRSVRLRRTSSWIPWLIGAAAAGLVTVYFLTLKNEPVPEKKKEPIVEEPRRESPSPIRPEPDRVIHKEVGRKAPRPPAPDKKEGAVVREEPPRETPNEEPRKTEPPEKVEPVKSQPVILTRITGPVSVRREGKTVELSENAEIHRMDLLVTPPRRLGRFTTNAGFSVSLEKNSNLSIEHWEDGKTRLQVRGTAFFEVERPLVIGTPEGELAVSAAAFQVELEEKRATLYVLEGAVDFKNEKGQVSVKAGQKSSARAGEKPSTPVKADVEARAGWRRRPDLTGQKEPYILHETGANRKLAGLVIGAPYGSGEKESMALGRATAERLDVGFAYAEFFRDTQKKFWINVDRGMEGDVAKDGTVGNERFTDRARKYTAEYLDHVRAAGGVGTRDPVPMIVQIRTQYRIDACEVDSAGWSKSTLAQLKTLYGQLLEKHQPTTRVEMRFRGLDEGAFAFQDDDAKVEGYMNPRNARNAMVFFFSSAVGKDNEAYSKILAEMIEFLYARRK